ncbi:hypothetical protein ACFVU9_30570, partial [Kitasatospora sp. NPDC057936]
TERLRDHLRRPALHRPPVIQINLSYTVGWTHPYRPGQQTPSNSPHSNGWTFIEKASIRWRIDLQVATPGLAARAADARVERADTHAERWSDHAPVTVAYAVAD